jgi:hypothetical protein
MDKNRAFAKDFVRFLKQSKFATLEPADLMLRTDIMVYAIAVQVLQQFGRVAQGGHFVGGPHLPGPGDPVDGTPIIPVTGPPPKKPKKSQGPPLHGGPHYQLLLSYALSTDIEVDLKKIADY